jgi:hypothetical protein
VVELKDHAELFVAVSIALGARQLVDALLLIEDRAIIWMVQRS